MKVLWITSRPIAGTCGTGKSSTSGNWLDAAYESCQNLSGVELSIVSLGNVDRLTEYEEQTCKMYLLPRGHKNHYNISESSHIQDWKTLKTVVKPDIVQIWGTEHTEYLLAARTFADVPIIVYIQGVVGKVAREFCHGLSLKERVMSISLQDLYRRSWMGATQQQYKKQAEVEKEILGLAQGAIVENDWCASHIYAIAPGCRIYRSKLPIKKDFFSASWSLDRVERHTVFTNAGGAPFKGHHIVFEALSLVKQKYPDVRLIIPGISRMGDGLVNMSRRTGYEKLLRRRIRRLGIRNNVEYIGVLTAEEMANRISRCNAYVMASCVENHSSSLIEAMVVGAPCIASFVGGVSSIAVHNESALLFNYDDPQLLAAYIVAIFEDDSLAQRLSNCAKGIRESRRLNIGKDFTFIYNDVKYGRE